MSDELGRAVSRRGFLRRSLVAGGVLLAAFDAGAWRKPFQYSSEQRLDDKFLGPVSFSEEAQVPMETALGAELDGRLYTDLTRLTPQNRVTRSESFYIRTRASELLELQKAWVMRVGGRVAQPFYLAIKDLEQMSKPMGLHLMECAGNARSVHFGLISATEWEGVLLLDVLENAKIRPEGKRVLISGFDSYATSSTTSVPGASWIFSWDELKSAQAFLATKMNGNPLTKDHGAPIRLMVPGWYGCTCIKWVNQIALVDDAAEATSQMQEFAARTQQNGVPRLARDYQPATIDQAAMPTRIEKWLVDKRLQYRVFGILWGGSNPVKTLEIRFNPDEDYVSVDSFEQKENDPWSLWTHRWTPRQPGTYMIRLRVREPQVVARRMDAGYYLRTVEITGV